MDTLYYVLGTLVMIAIPVGAIASAGLIAHSRTEHDHGPDCRFCHPRLPRPNRR